jgi:hypothetical protein
MTETLQITLTGESARAVRFLATLFEDDPGKITEYLLKGWDLDRIANGCPERFLDFCNLYDFDEEGARDVATQAGRFFERRFEYRPRPRHADDWKTGREQTFEIFAP